MAGTNPAISQNTLGIFGGGRAYLPVSFSHYDKDYLVSSSMAPSPEIGFSFERKTGNKGFSFYAQSGLSFYSTRFKFAIPSSQGEISEFRVRTQLSPPLIFANAIFGLALNPKCKNPLFIGTGPGISFFKPSPGESEFTEFAKYQVDFDYEFTQKVAPHLNLLIRYTSILPDKNRLSVQFNTSYGGRDFIRGKYDYKSAGNASGGDITLSNMYFSLQLDYSWSMKRTD